MISTSPIKISCVIAADRVPDAVRALHEAFELGDDAVREEDPSGRAPPAGDVMSYRVGVVGATGAVGSTLLEVLAERGVPGLRGRRRSPPSARPASGSRSARSELECRPLADETIQGLDLVLSSAGGAVSAEWAPRLVAAGAVVVDNTSFWRMHPDVPLVVSEVNPDAAERHNGLIANPNCSTMQMMVALAPIQRHVGIERIVVSTYQSVSGTGQRAVDELTDQAHAVLHGQEAPTEVYPHPIAFNVLPQVETFKDGDDYTTEERKLMAETRKILELGDEEVGISATCARVPVFVGHSQSVNVQTREPLSPEECRRAACRRTRGAGRRRARRGRLPDCRPTPPGATRSWSGGSGAIPRTRAASTSGSSATTCERVRPPMPSRLRRSCISGT